MQTNNSFQDFFIEQFFFLSKLKDRNAPSK